MAATLIRYIPRCFYANRCNEPPKLIGAKEEFVVKKSVLVFGLLVGSWTCMIWGNIFVFMQMEPRQDLTSRVNLIWNGMAAQ